MSIIVTTFRIFFKLKTTIRISYKCKHVKVPYLVYFGSPSTALSNTYRTVFIYVRLTTGPVPPIRPIPTTGPIPTNGPISESNPTNGPIFPTTGPTFKRHVHKWADHNVKRDVFPR